jgi:5-methylcytosine-specific restriction endonuclease McrA
MNKKDEPIWCTMYRDQVIKPKQRERFTEQKGRTKESQSGFYTTKEWIAIRDRRRSENPICIECEKQGRIRPMKIVDHIISIEERPDLALDYSNTQSLCDYHHILKTNADKKRANHLRRLETGRKIMKDLETGGG